MPRCSLRSARRILPARGRSFCFSFWVLGCALAGLSPASSALACGGCGARGARASEPGAVDGDRLAQRRAGPERRYRGKKIDLDLQDAEIRHVVRLIADVSGLNIVVGDEVQGKVTMKLKQVPWDQALHVILKTKGLGMKWEGENIVRVAPQARLDEERRRALDQQASCVERAPLKTRIIPVNYARAVDLVPLVKDTLSPRGKVTYDERTNVLIVKDVVGCD